MDQNVPGNSGPSTGAGAWLESSPKLWIFDLDGTLVSAEAGMARVINDLACRRGLPPVTREDLSDLMWNGAVIGDLAKSLFPDQPPEKLTGLANQVFLEYERRRHHVLEPFPGIEGLLSRLEQARIPWCIATNNSTGTALLIANGQGWLQRASEVIGVEPGIRPKPMPDMITQACLRCGVDPSEAVMVGDLMADQEAAQAAGVPFIQVAWAGQAVHYGLPYVDPVRDVSQLHGLLDRFEV